MADQVGPGELHAGQADARKTVLIADDQPRVRQLVRATIGSDQYAQYAVVEAADGDVAWQLLQQHRPAVALLDVQMPGRDGLAVTVQLPPV